MQDTDTQQRKFILNIVSECIEQKKLLDVVVNAFYDTTGKLMSRRDRNQFVSKEIIYVLHFSLVFILY